MNCYCVGCDQLQTLWIDRVRRAGAMQGRNYKGSSCVPMTVLLKREAEDDGKERRARQYKGGLTGLREYAPKRW